MKWQIYENIIGIRDFLLQACLPEAGCEFDLKFRIQNYELRIKNSMVVFNKQGQ